MSQHWQVIIGLDVSAGDADRVVSGIFDWLRQRGIIAPEMRWKPSGG
ncbi:MAG: hypothetical protein GX542_12715 [Rhodococcus sp.]|nr:hypothetical protein [Rhodococcus sp. (in: high G+C Gram-positive bacteria)]